MGADSRATVGRLIELNELRLRNEVAFVYQDQTLTFGEFAAGSRQLASALHMLGVRRQDRVAALSENRLELCRLYGANELAGFITVGVNYRLAPPEMAHVLSDSGARVLVFEAQYAAVVEQLRATLPGVETYVCIGGPRPAWAQEFEALEASGDPAGPPFRAEVEDTAYLFYTSGTTGRAKGCMLGQHNIYRLAQACSSDLGISCVDRTLLAMPLVHIGAKSVQLASHVQGAPAIILNHFDPPEYLRTLESAKVTVGHLAPTMIQMLLEDPLSTQVDVSSLRVVLYSAAPMPVPVLRQAISVFGKVFQQQYGLTEGGGASLHAKLHDPDGDEKAQRRLASTGVPFAGCEIQLTDDQGRVVPQGEAGEICIRAEGLMQGYWNNSAATMDALRDGWLRTGDIGRFDEDGFLYVVDRKKDMIISGGHNIYSREVEEALFAHPAILEAAVIGVPDDKWGESVCAIVVPRRAGSLSPEDVVGHCRQLLASYKKPRHVVFLDTLPKLASGKVNKLALRARMSDDPTSPAKHG